MAKFIIILGVGGRMGVGKTALCKKVGEYVAALRPTTATTNMPFGGELRKFIKENSSIAEEHLDNGEYKTTRISDLGYSNDDFDSMALGVPHSKTLTIRELLQQVGHGKREKDPYFWTWRWKRSLLEYINARPGCVFITVDDIRYPNEALMVRHTVSNGRERIPFAPAIYTRTLLLPIPRGADPSAYKSSHASENNFDFWKEDTEQNVPAVYPDTGALFNWTLCNTWGRIDAMAAGTVSRILQETEGPQS